MVGVNALRLLLQVQFIRPRCNPGDMELWWEGLAGFQAQSVHCVATSQGPSPQECVAATALASSRLVRDIVWGRAS